MTTPAHIRVSFFTQDGHRFDEQWAVDMLQAAARRSGAHQVVHAMEGNSLDDDPCPACETRLRHAQC
jgi:hypothetical protein